MQTFTYTIISHLKNRKLSDIHMHIYWSFAYSAPNTMGKAPKPVRRKDTEVSWYISFRRSSLQGKSITCSKDLKIQLTKRYNTSKLICTSKKKIHKSRKKKWTSPRSQWDFSPPLSSEQTIVTSECRLFLIQLRSMA